MENRCLKLVGVTTMLTLLFYVDNIIVYRVVLTV